MGRDAELKKLVDELAQAFLAQRDIEDKITDLRGRISVLEEEKRMSDEGILMYRED